MASYISGQQDELLQRYRSGYPFDDDTFRQMHLDGMQFPGIHLMNSQVERCGLGNANLEAARFDSCRVTNTSLRQVQGRRSAWVDTRFRLNDMAGAVFSDGCFNACRFDETLMSGLEFGGATITGCEFDLCDLSYTSFSGALIVRSKFRDARLGSANLMSCRFDGAQLIDVDLRDANLQYVNLRNAVLVRVHLSGANLQGADLEGATFIEVQGLPDDIAAQVRSRQASPAIRGQTPAARAVDLQLEQGLEHFDMHNLARLSREVLRTYVIESAGALLSEDRAAALLRQRSLSFADLMRFVKERFPHDELGQVIVEGDQVFIRTNAGDVPLTRYGQSNAARTAGGGTGGSTRSAAPPPPPTAAPRPASPPPPSAAPPRSEPSMPRPMEPSAPRTPPPAPAAPPPPAQLEPAGEDSFEPDRFGMIDL